MDKKSLTEKLKTLAYKYPMETTVLFIIIVVLFAIIVNKLHIAELAMVLLTIVAFAIAIYYGRRDEIEIRQLHKKEQKNKSKKHKE